MLTLTQSLDRAVSHHQAGELRQAQELYTQILGEDPNNVDALHLLGLIAGQFGRHDLAIPLILQALRLKPDFADAHNNLGNALRSQNKLHEAVASYRNALRFKPNHWEAHNNLGNALLDQGKLGEAVTSYEHALRFKPDLAEAYSNMGFALRRLGNAGAAISRCREALRLKPCLAEAHANLANALLDQDRVEEAIASYRQAVRLRPDLAEAHNNLGNALQKQGRPDEAMACFQEAVRYKPDFAEAHANLGTARRVLGMLDQAVASFDEALRLKPDFAEAHNNLGHAQQEQGKLDEALASYRESLRLRPDLADAHNNLGSALIAQGEVDQALAHIQEAVRLDPGHAMAWHQLGRLVRDGKYRFCAADQDQVHRLLSNPLGIKNKALLHFTLAYVLEQDGDYDTAFEHYRQGNECKRQCPELWPGFDIQAVRRGVDATIAVFNRELFARLASIGHPSEVPVFILGMPRSGTSLVEQILSSHGRFAGAGELLEIGSTANRLAVLMQGVAEYPACTARLTRETAWDLAERYLKRLRRDAMAALRVSDKMPLNFLHLGLIAVLFPRARVIHCRRDARDTCVSCFCENFENLHFTSSLEDLGQYYREYARLMAHWQQVLPLAMFEMQYEQLISRPQALSRQVLAFCGLDWDDHCIRFYETRRPVHTASNLQVRQPISARSVGRWRRYHTHLGRMVELLSHV